MQHRAAALLFIAFAGIALTGARTDAQARQPNIVVIVGDDMGYADIGAHGCQDIPTPHLDALAAAGVRCTNGYVSGPYCSPTRAGLLTGRYQQRFGHEFNPRDEDLGLPLSERTIADRLREAGYVTGLVGKWHLGTGPEFHPQRRGFDEFFGFLGGARNYLPGRGGPLLRGTKRVDELQYLTDAFGREAAAFIERHHKAPFFLYLAFNAVHTPMQANDARLQRFKDIPQRDRRTYAAMMSAMDDAVGLTLDKIRDAGLEKDTLVFFFSDNGGPTMPGTTINASSNAPLRGSKRTTLEGGIRVPFLIKWPGRLEPGTTYDGPVIQLDVLPTALAAAGIDPRGDDSLDGVNLLDHLTGAVNQPPHEALYWRLGDQMAVRRGDWKLVRYDPAADGEPGPATTQRLYNIANDVGEAHDLIADEPAKAAELQAAWAAWDWKNVRPLWGSAKKQRAARAGGDARVKRRARAVQGE